MSKTSHFLLLIFTAAILSLTAAAQHAMEVTIRVDGQTAFVSGKFVAKRKGETETIRFLESMPGASKLAERVSDVKAFDAAGAPLPLKRFTASQYDASAQIAEWTYKVDLRPLANQAAAAHSSWIAGDAGLLMLDDLLPQEGRVAARVTLKIPAGMSVYTTEVLDGDAYRVRDTEKAVFFVGRGLRQVESTGKALLISGEWQFSDSEAEVFASEIVDNYTRLLAGRPRGEPQIAIFKFPHALQPGQWEADTRGSTVTIVSSDTPFKSQSIQRLHEQLRHEIFHLWFPNGVNLSGNYDWFYEGFALYQSLKLGVATNRIRFDDYLATLSAAYNIDRRISNRRALVESARSRSSGAGLEVYARGMLIAFLSDVAMLENSKGKRSTDDLVREIYQKHSLESTRADGNDAITAIMRNRPELRPIVERYVSAADQIDLGPFIAPAGLEEVANGREVALQVIKKPGGRQKDLLNRLGYNNWRKSTSRQ